MTTVSIVGAGKGGRALLEMLVGDPTVTIAGIADQKVERISNDALDLLKRYA